MNSPQIIKAVLCAVALAVAFGGATHAQIKPLSADLREYAYPFPVQAIQVAAPGRALTLAYMELRPERESRPAVLLFHGKNFSGAYWERTARALAGRGHRVVMPDQIGFGKSDKPTDFQYSFHALAAHNAALLDALGVKQAVVVGHSMGGMLAARFAQMYPARTLGLVLVNPLGLEDWKRVVPYQTVEALEQIALNGTPETVKGYMRRVYFDGQWKPEYDPMLDIQAGWTLGPDHALTSRVSALTSEMVFTQPVLYEFADIQAPALLIIGQRDRTALRGAAPAEVAKTLGDYPGLGREAAARFPRARLVALEGVGHVPQVEAWDAYIAALTEFAADPAAAVPGR